MLEPHLADLTPLSWEEVYAGWKSDELKYYWRKVKHRAVPRDMRYIAKGFSEALDLARQRDQRGILALRRAVLGNPASQEAKEASAVLTEIGATR